MELIHTLYEPAGAGPHPALFAFHGWGSSALDLVGLAPYIADGRFLVICPQGPMEVPIGPTRGFGWYPIRMGGPPDPDAIEAAGRNAERFIDQALERYPIDKRKVVLLGFSQGGTMAYRLAIANPSRYTALVAISTWFPPELKHQVKDADALGQLPTLVQHGRADDMIDIGRARTSVENLRALHVPLQYREYDCGHEITADGLMDLSKFLHDKVVAPVLTV
jgi:phospholipase/carboxylesterase